MVGTGSASPVLERSPAPRSQEEPDFFSPRGAIDGDSGVFGQVVTPDSMPVSQVGLCGRLGVPVDSRAPPRRSFRCQLVSSAPLTALRAPFACALAYAFTFACVPSLVPSLVPSRLPCLSQSSQGVHEPTFFLASLSSPISLLFSPTPHPSYPHTHPLPADRSQRHAGLDPHTLPHALPGRRPRRRRPLPPGANPDPRHPPLRRFSRAAGPRCLSARGRDAGGGADERGEREGAQEGERVGGWVRGVRERGGGSGATGMGGDGRSVRGEWGDRAGLRGDDARGAGLRPECARGGMLSSESWIPSVG